MDINTFIFLQMLMTLITWCTMYVFAAFVLFVFT